MAILTIAGPEVHERLDRVVSLYHPELRDAGVTFQVRFAEGKEDASGEIKPPIMAQGYPAAAKVRIVSYSDRVNGMADAEITIDKGEWDMLSERECDALLDHEVTHIELKMKTVKDEDGEETEVLDRDDLDRPKLKMRRHDNQIGVFHDVVRRYGRASPEQRLWAGLEEKRTQLWLPYLGPEDVDEELDEDADDATILAIEQKQASKIVRRLKTAGASR